MRGGCYCPWCGAMRRRFQALEEQLRQVIRQPGSVLPRLSPDHLEDYRDALAAVEAILEKDRLPSPASRERSE